MEMYFPNGALFMKNRSERQMVLEFEIVERNDCIYIYLSSHNSVDMEVFSFYNISSISLSGTLTLYFHMP